MAALALDTLTISKRLVSRGVPQPQAEAIAEELNSAMHVQADEFATKQDLLLFKQDLLREIQTVRHELGAVRHELGNEINGVRHELGNDINGVRHELDGVRFEMKALEQRLTLKLGGLMAAILAFFKVMEKFF